MPSRSCTEKSLVIPLAFLLFLVLGISVSPAWASDDPPPGAVGPVKTYTSTIYVQKLIAGDIECINASNPSGYAITRKRISGHSYVDATGYSFDGFYSSWAPRQGYTHLKGPYKVLKETIVSMKCMNR